ncbi:hypothetical protein KC19_VG056800 [Ceratodon purpureus]|uniref:Uncharacterized protein n=1 Tax=Ceratodon purpureus TaxID=3225 RepID=A0A8T0HME0_CERPU|nr:hypothetical protein KC19_VG056800 [Ceratodon purpureus]
MLTWQRFLLDLFYYLIVVTSSKSGRAGILGGRLFNSETQRHHIICADTTGAPPNATYLGTSAGQFLDGRLFADVFANALQMLSPIAWHEFCSRWARRLMDENRDWSTDSGRSQGMLSSSLKAG